jgi:hypothetical protein
MRIDVFTDLVCPWRRLDAAAVLLEIIGSLAPDAART